MSALRDPHDLLCHLRSLMPGVAGVVLASGDGRPLAHDVPCDARALAAAGLSRRRPDAPTAGTLVTAGASVYLVLFLPPDVASQWSALPA